MARRRFYMPALLAERTETREGRVWSIRVYQDVHKADLLADGSGFRRRTPGAVLAVEKRAA
jgi:hypothetical protein